MAFVQPGFFTKAGGGSSAGNSASSITTTTGNNLFVAIAASQALTTAPTDGAIGNTYVLQQSIPSGGGVWLTAWTARNINGGVTIISSSISLYDIYVAEYSGLLGPIIGSNSLQTVSPGGTANAIKSGNVAMGSTNCLLWGICVDTNALTNANVSPVAGTPISNSYSTSWLGTTSNACGLAEDYTTSGTVGLNWTAGSGSTFDGYLALAIAVALNPVASGPAQSMPGNSNFNPQGNTFLVTTNATPSTASAQLVSFNPTLSAQVAAQASGLQNCPPAVCVANLGTAVVYVSFTSALRTAIVPAANPQLELPVFPGVERVFTLPQSPNVGSATPYALQINTISSAASQPLLITFGEQHLT